MVDQSVGSTIDAEELLEVNIKDEAKNEPTMEVPQESASDVDVTEDVVADEFILLKEEGDETPEVIELTEDQVADASTVEEEVENA